MKWISSPDEYHLLLGHNIEKDFMSLWQITATLTELSGCTSASSTEVFRAESGVSNLRLQWLPVALTKNYVEMNIGYLLYYFYRSQTILTFSNYEIGCL